MYIIPEYGRAGFIIGGKGGAGVVVVRNRAGGWTSPAFFNTGGLSIGLQAGAAGGSIVYLLMDRRARSSRSAARASSRSTPVPACRSSPTRTRPRPRRARATRCCGPTSVVPMPARRWVRRTSDYDNGRTRDYYGRDVNVNALLDGSVTAPGAQALARVLPR